ncbi:MAG TPA: hypothetical protein HPP83_00785 [Candidatus Hydrogenedentes bacterium]|nr:hypothetical protein [Candidatus Hydrogenedentota bacterium]
MKTAWAAIYERFQSGICDPTADIAPGKVRIGAELKFPFVNPDGTAVSQDKLFSLWEFLCTRGWRPVEDALTGRIVGARKPGERNDTIASYETGYPKPEFALAHVGDLHQLQADLEDLVQELRFFSEQRDVRFLGYGIHPVTPPSKDLLMKKARSSFWDIAFPSNEVIPPERGDDVHLFTINAASHVHISVPPESVIQAVNVLNGFAGAQIALTANSSVWRNEVDPRLQCVSEKLWDWWEPAAGRVGVPKRPFEDMLDYCRFVTELEPVYVQRDGQPLIPREYASFADYFSQDTARAANLDGEEVKIIPLPEDVELHNSCYWFNARISRYYTVENRVFDQQPADSLLCPAALTLGLTSESDEAWEELRAYDWQTLRQTRDAACEKVLLGAVNGLSLRTLATRTIEIAERGLRKRGLGEEQFLEPLKQRLDSAVCPSAAAVELFKTQGIQGLVEARSL